MNRRGLTLIELLVAVAITGLLVGGIYRTFISQQHTYTVQEQIVDMQQNVRLAINRMTRELRMAGYGRVGATFFGSGKVHGIYQNAITPGGGGNSVTVVGGYQAVATLSANATSGSTSILVNDASGFNTGLKQYISINGTESRQIQKITGNQIDFKGGTQLSEDHLAGEPVFLIMAITYSIGMFEGKSSLLRDDHLGLGLQPVAENIENLRFRYVMDDGTTLDVVPAAQFDNIRMIQVTLVARTDRIDPELTKAGDGFRRRTLNSNIQVRNLGLI
jgi:prepilin-type N-terminal cleavage/methylation domain-containing protein